MVQVDVDRQDSFGGSLNHKLDYMIGNREHGQLVQIDGVNPLPVSSTAGDLAHRIAVAGRKFYASDGDQNDLVLGQTSFANTTPTFMLSNPAGSGLLCIPLFFTLAQSGTVGGAAIDIIVELDVDRYASGGVAETVKNSRFGLPVANRCLLRSNATATAGYGVRVDGITTGQDVSPAEGALQQYLWSPTSVMDILDPGTCLKVFTYAGTTGPSWFWTFCWAEVPPDWMS